MHTTIEKKVFWEFDSIIMQNMSHNLVLFYASTWPSDHVIETIYSLHKKANFECKGSEMEIKPNEAKKVC